MTGIAQKGNVSTMVDAQADAKQVAQKLCVLQR